MFLQTAGIQGLQRPVTVKRGTCTQRGQPAHVRPHSQVTTWPGNSRDKVTAPPGGNVHGALAGPGEAGALVSLLPPLLFSQQLPHFPWHGFAVWGQGSAVTEEGWPRARRSRWLAGQSPRRYSEVPWNCPEAEVRWKASLVTSATSLFYASRTGLSHRPRPGSGSVVLSSGALGAEHCQAPAGHPFPIRPRGAGPKGLGAPSPRAGIQTQGPWMGLGVHVHAQARAERAAEVGAGQHSVRPWPEIPTLLLPSHVSLGKSLTSLCLSFPDP